MNMSLMAVKAANLLLFITDMLFFSVLRLLPGKKSVGGVLIVRMDSIGDYILFRNFLETLSVSSKYSGKPVTLVGNVLWRDLTDTFDAGFLAGCIWIDRNKFKKNLLYRYKNLIDIRNKGFATAIEAAYSREILFGDTIVRASGAKECIGSVISQNKPGGWKSRRLSSGFYTSLIPMKGGVVFEFNRNKEFFTGLLQPDAVDTKLHLDTSMMPETIPGPYIVVVPGAQHAFRCWSLHNFAGVIDSLLKDTGYSIVICGSKAERPLADQLLKNNKSPRIINTVGTETLPEYAKIIAGAKLALTNETSAVHFAAAVKTPFVCISNGHDIGRFHPYPEEIFNRGIFLYPFENKADYQKMIKASEAKQGLAVYDINDITVERVLGSVKELLHR